ncbi:hypothetical protein DL96DRAFT_488290 [Flagelloscypha sp. PMI_526]|nr:hypothetical protein DL96DRAFT_488290 [Flagelloscypha sp. PMI_526]
MAITICDLPPEILQQIFRSYVTGTFAKPENWNRIRSRFQNRWLKSLPLVCKAWNALVCSSPELWAYIYTNWRKATLMHHFARSLNARLYLYLTCPPQQWTARKITEISERVGAVHVWSENTTCINNLVQSWAQTPFPHLTKLQVAFDAQLFSRMRSNHVEINFAAWIQKRCPSLSFLDLCWPSSFNFTSLPLGIQFLSLHSRCPVPPAHGSVQPDDFFRSLAPLHALHTLELSGEYISTVLSPNCPSYTLELPNLEVLRLSEVYNKAIERLLAAIDSPPLLDLRITGYLPSEITDESEQLIDTIIWMCQPIEGARDFLKVNSEPKGLSAEWVRHWLDGGPPITVSIDFRFAADCPELWSPSELAYRELLVQTWKAFTSETLVQVEAKISGDCIFYPDDWVDTFGLASLKALEEIGVEDVRRPTSILTALEETDVSEDGVEQALFPSLKRLRLRCFHFEQQQIAPALNDSPLPVDLSTNGTPVQHQHVPPAYTTSPSRQLLQSMLTSRRNLGFGIEELTLEKSFGLDADWLLEVDALVKRLNVL